MTSSRCIAHVDMDAFYASVELLRYPDLRGEMLVVGGRNIDAPQQMVDGTRRYARLGAYVGRGVVTTASYEARALGVFSAMGLMKAAQKTPNAYLLPADFTRYRYYSKLFKAAVATISSRIENRGIDEIYVDLSHLSVEQSSEQLGQQIQSAVFAATGLTCSVGISPNKLLSKIASDLNKPNGVCVLTLADVPEMIWPLSVAKINGIGPKSQEKLARLGIQTIGELATAEAAVLQQHFGLSYAQWLLRVAQGEDDSPVVLESEPKSISRERTFDRDMHVTHDKAELSRLLITVCEQLEQDLHKNACRAYTIGIKLRFDDFSIITRDLTLEHPVLKMTEIIAAARQNLRRTQIRHRKLRLLGVRATKLIAESTYAELTSQPEQLSLGDFF